MATRDQTLAKYAHAVIFVVKANDPRLKDGKYKDTLQKIREHFREDGKITFSIEIFFSVNFTEYFDISIINNIIPP